MDRSAAAAAVGGASGVLPGKSSPDVGKAEAAKRLRASWAGQVKALGMEGPEFRRRWRDRGGGVVRGVARRPFLSFFFFFSHFTGMTVQLRLRCWFHPRL